MVSASQASAPRHEMVRCVADSPLMMAVQGGYIDCVRLLLDFGGTSDSAAEWTPLNCACNGGHPEILRLLCNASASVNTADAAGRTPLAHGALSGSNVGPSLAVPTCLRRPSSSLAPP